MVQESRQRHFSILFSRVLIHGLSCMMVNTIHADQELVEFGLQSQALYRALMAAKHWSRPKRKYGHCRKMNPDGILYRSGRLNCIMWKENGIYFTLQVRMRQVPFGHREQESWFPATARSVRTRSVTTSLCLQGTLKSK